MAQNLSARLELIRGDITRVTVDASCFRLAAEHGLETVAFPPISSGIYGFPVERAAPIALREIAAALQDNGQLPQALVVCFSDADLAKYQVTQYQVVQYQVTQYQTTQCQMTQCQMTQYSSGARP